MARKKKKPKVKDWKPDEAEVDAVAKVVHNRFPKRMWDWDKIDERSKSLQRQDILWTMEELVRRGWFPCGTYEKGQLKILDRLVRILKDAKKHDYSPEDVLRELQVMVKEGPRYD